MHSTTDLAAALDFARGALEHYYVNDPRGIGLREPNTNLSTPDLLATAIEELFAHLDPDGLRTIATGSGQQPPAAPGPGTTVTMTADWDPQPWRPSFPGRRGGRH